MNMKFINKPENIAQLTLLIAKYDSLIDECHEHEETPEINEIYLDYAQVYINLQNIDEKIKSATETECVFEEEKRNILMLLAEQMKDPALKEFIQNAFVRTGLFASGPLFPSSKFTPMAQEAMTSYRPKASSSDSREESASHKKAGASPLKKTYGLS